MFQNTIISDKLSLYKFFKQLNFDLYRAKQIMRRVKKKTLSFNMNALSLFINIGYKVNFDNYVHLKNID